VAYAFNGRVSHSSELQLTGGLVPKRKYDWASTRADADAVREEGPPETRIMVTQSMSTILTHELKLLRMVRKNLLIDEANLFHGA
jgi:hypothetical protein